MTTPQQWQVTFGTGSTIVDAENWLGALAEALPDLGMDLGAMGRLVCTPAADGSATARDPRSGGVLRIVPLVLETPPAFSMPESSFAGLNVPHLRVAPASEDPRAVLQSSSETGIVSPGEEAAEAAAATSAELAPVGVAAPSEVAPVVVAPVEVAPSSQADLVDRLEDLFLLLAEVSEAPTANAACAFALRIAGELVAAEAGAVLIKTSRGDGLRFRAVLGPASKSLLDTMMPLDRGIAGFAFQLGLALTIDDARRDDRHYSRVDKQTGYVTRAVLAAPVRADQGGVYGVLELMNPPRPFTDDDLELCTRVAATLGEYFRSRDQ